MSELLLIPVALGALVFTIGGLLGGTFMFMQAFTFGDRKQFGVPLGQSILRCLAWLLASAASFGVCLLGCVIFEVLEGDTRTEKVTVCSEVNGETVCRKEIRTFPRENMND